MTSENNLRERRPSSNAVIQQYRRVRARRLRLDLLLLGLSTTGFILAVGGIERHYAALGSVVCGAFALWLGVSGRGFGVWVVACVQAAAAVVLFFVPGKFFVPLRFPRMASIVRQAPINTPTVSGSLQGDSGRKTATLYYRDHNGIEHPENCSPRSRILSLPAGQYAVRIEASGRTISREREIIVSPGKLAIVTADPLPAASADEMAARAERLNDDAESIVYSVKADFRRHQITADEAERSYRQMQSKLNDALKAAQAATQEDPRSKAAWKERVRALFNLGRYLEAKNCLLDAEQHAGAIERGKAWRSEIDAKLARPEADPSLFTRSDQ